MGDFQELFAAVGTDLEFLLEDLGTVVRTNLVADGAGGQLAMDTVVAEVPCLVTNTGNSVTSGFREMERVSYQSTFEAMVPLGTDIQPGDSFTVGNNRLEVTGVSEDTYAAFTTVTFTKQGG